MAAKKIKSLNDLGGLVYSTNPDFKIEEGQEEIITLPANKQPLRIKLDTKQRAGKAVTLVTGFAGAAADCEALGKQLKTHCGTGGSVKDGDIIVQGDNCNKILQWLQKNGYSAAKKL
jgi:translation initiation factor 1